jgi:hypothetical protein
MTAPGYPCHDDGQPTAVHAARYTEAEGEMA